MARTTRTVYRDEQGRFTKPGKGKKMSMRAPKSIRRKG